MLESGVGPDPSHGHASVRSESRRDQTPIDFKESKPGYPAHYPTGATPQAEEVVMADVKRYEEGDNWVEIDLDLCVAAGECVNVCPADVYEVAGGKVKADNIGECIECGACEDVCPTNAILRHWAW